MTTPERSYIMSRIRSQNTKPEKMVRSWLFKHGYRFRKNVRGLPGTPDIVMRKYRTCIFVHGCFWHGHDHIRWPKSNVEFWRTKIERNRTRDAEEKEKLRHMGWNVITIWECQLTKERQAATLTELEYKLNDTLLTILEHKRPRPLPFKIEEEEPLPMAAEETIDFGGEMS